MTISKWKRRVISVAILLLLCFDNLAFCITHSTWQYAGSEGFRLSEDDRTTLRVLQAEHRDKVIFCESLEFGYLMPTYAKVRPWLCHKFNTPNYIERQKALRGTIANNSCDPSSIPQALEVLVLSASRETALLHESKMWSRQRIENNKWQVWFRSNNNQLQTVAATQ